MRNNKLYSFNGGNPELRTFGPAFNLVHPLPTDKTPVLPHPLGRDRTVVYEHGETGLPLRAWEPRARHEVQAVMSEQANAYQRKAEARDAAAERVTDPEVRAVYLAMGARWRKMAERQQAIEDFLSERGEPGSESTEHGNP
jgi:hypothetical protein